MWPFSGAYFVVLFEILLVSREHVEVRPGMAPSIDITMLEACSGEVDAAFKSSFEAAFNTQSICLVGQLGPDRVMQAWRHSYVMKAPAAAVAVRGMVPRTIATAR